MWILKRSTYPYDKKYPKEKVPKQNIGISALCNYSIVLDFNLILISTMV